MTVAVVIPTYDEAGNVERIVSRLLAAVPEARVLVVDDASPDGTGEIAQRMADADERVDVLHRAGREGLGAAYRAGMRHALDAGADTVVQMDADGSHAPEQLPRLLAAAREVDVALGSRWVAGGSVVDWPASRRLISRGGSAYARLALGVPVRDITGGYRVWSARALESVDLDAVDSTGYCFQIDLLWRAVRAGATVAEVPITFEERRVGASKMSTRIVVEAMLRTTGWGLAGMPARLRRAPLIRRALGAAQD